MTDPDSADAPPQLGRRRAASAISRLFGHMHRAPTPRHAWVVTQFRLERDPGVDAVRESTMRRMGSVPRFRSKLVVSRSEVGYFEEVGLDPDYHFVVNRDARTREEVERVIAEQNHWEHDPDRPLWRVVYMPDVDALDELQAATATKRGALLLLVISHAVSDGVGLVDVFLSKLIDPADAATLRMDSPES